MKFNLMHPRYENMTYNRCGRSGLLLPALSLGLWHNFGFVDNFENCRKILRAAFDSGITHFDLANNYGPPYGSAEENFGNIWRKDFASHRDELVISTKAGYDMWAGPYGDKGSKKYLISSLDQSLKRMKLDYVDIFYHHRPDVDTPLEETMGAFDQILRQGKALYVGVSRYTPEQMREAESVLKSMGHHCLIHQPKYSMLVRDIEHDVLPELETLGIGCIPFSPLAQGVLTSKYLKGVPENSRAAKSHGHLQERDITPELITKIQRLNDLAQKRGQTLAQMALAWVLRDRRITSVVIGVSSVEQLNDNLKTLENKTFTDEELNLIDSILK